jgi:hypothetical protein
MTDKDPQVAEDEKQLEQLDDEIRVARQHLKEQTHEGEQYFYEEGTPTEVTPTATSPEDEEGGQSS